MSRNRGAAEGRSPWWDRSQQLLMAATVALLVAAVLIPSESATPLGTHVVLVMAWLLLTAVWLVRCLLDPRGGWQVGSVEGALGLFLLAHSVSALVMLRCGHARATLNALWLWIAFGALFLAVRHLFRRPLAQRALVSAMISLAAGLSLFGLYQMGYSNPLMRARYAQNPEATLQEAGVDAPLGSPQRQHFENRLASLEPIGSFELTNSLAGLLTPSLLLALFVVGSFLEWSPIDWRGELPVLWRALARAACLLLVTLLPALAVAVCLMLTKSRSAYGALLIGIPLLGLACAVPRKWFRWPILLGVVIVLVVMVAVTVGLGGLDRQVITEAPKSLTYRLQYWTATRALIADHPWFGCGPGNFKSFYTRYKVPEASETVADPHNFVLEIAATAGLPALMLGLVFGLMWAVLLVRSRRLHTGTAAVGRAGSAGRRASDIGSPAAIYAGVATGFLLAYPAGWAGGLPPDFALLWVAGPATAASLLALHRWVLRGDLPPFTLVVAGIGLLVNLLAAGGIGFPGVGEWVWLLAALALNSADSRASDASARPAMAGRFAWATTGTGLVAVALLIGACYLTMYRPVLSARQEVDRAREAGTATAAKRALTRAIAQDPWWAEPWEFLTELESQQWLAASSDDQLAAFFAARDGWLARERNSSQVYRLCGDWLLTMFAASRRTDLGTEAVRAYAQAVELYPHSGILHAQLAWACHATGSEDLARQHADEALRLDALMPHTEFKLARQRLVGDDLAARGPLAQGPPPVENAEQLMRRIRNVKDH